MKYLSICSGIEAASVAWAPLGWKPAAFAEIEKFPCAVLKHHYPDVANLGDITHKDFLPRVKKLGEINLLVGGTHSRKIMTPQLAVRMLTPTECERLQGFPDGYTHIKHGRPRSPDQLCPDGPRYKALGNSMAVPVMRWLGERIADYARAT